MKVKLFTLIFTVLTGIGSVHAGTDGIRIGDVYYNLDSKNKTAEVTFQNFFTDEEVPEDDALYRFAFNIYCYMENISIPSSVKYKGQEYQVKNIGYDAFRRCSNLTTITIPNSVSSIQMYAFAECNSLTSVTISHNVTNISYGAFGHCQDLTSINVESDNPKYCDIDGVLFERRGMKLLNYPAGKVNKTYVIPDNVTYIHACAFWGCNVLNSVILPNSITGLGENAFRDCYELTSMVIPNSVTSIGDRTFRGCFNLKSIVIPNSVTSIGKNAFELCPNVTIYTASNARIYDDMPYDRLKRVSQTELAFYYPFSIFAKEYIEKRVNEWQQKGEFERTIDWQKRVNDQTRQQKIKELLAEAEQNYIAFHLKSITINPTLGKYDADNEVFAMTDEQYGTFYMAVPLAEAPNFKKNWDNKKLTFQLQIKDDQFKLASISITLPDSKEYTYRNTDAVNYNLAEIEYNFAPIDLNLAGANTPQSRQNITTTKLKAGKSQVDTNIPETGASNPNTFVVIFANEDYKNETSVPFAKNDGAIFQKYCHKTLGIPIDNVHFVENASFNDIRIQLSWLNDICNAFDGNASLIVYYAGHGIPDETSKSSYLLPVDGDGRYMASAYKLDELYQKLGAMNAKSVTVFMDACFSGSKRDNEGMLASARGVALKSIAGQPQGNMVVFSAAQGQETAYPIVDEQHGMFTYYLLKKLQETKGDVTLKALGEYITTNVRQQSVVKNGKSQTPCVMPATAVADTWQNWKLK